MLSDAARVGSGDVPLPLSPPQGSPAVPAVAANDGGPAGTEASSRPRLGPNPVITYDSETRTVLFQFFDRESGEVKRQFPAEHQLEAYRRQVRMGGEAGPTSEGVTPAPVPGRSADATKAGPPAGIVPLVI